jgi:hypothetical protein
MGVASPFLKILDQVIAILQCLVVKGLMYGHMKVCTSPTYAVPPLVLILISRMNERSKLQVDQGRGSMEARKVSGPLVHS